VSVIVNIYFLFGHISISSPLIPTSTLLFFNLSPISFFLLGHSMTIHPKKKKAPYHLVFLEKLGTFKQTNICGQTIATSIQYFVSPSWSNIFIDPQNELDVEWPSFFPFVLSLSRCWTTSVCPLLHTMIYNPTPVSNITFHTDNLYRTSSVAIVLTAPAVIVLTASASFALTASAATCIN